MSDVYDIQRCGIKSRCQERDERIAELEAENKQMREALREAADSVDEYAQYAGDYLRKKHGVDDDIARFRAIAGGE